MLSPLSWWNDLFVNVPLALAFAWIVSFFYKPAFEICVIVGYWLSNITVDLSTLTVVGSPFWLDEIGGFVTIDAIDVKDVGVGWRELH